jgi:hypothetical protein
MSQGGELTSLSPSTETMPLALHHGVSPLVSRVGLTLHFALRRGGLYRGKRAGSFGHVLFRTLDACNVGNGALYPLGSTEDDHQKNLF